MKMGRGKWKLKGPRRILQKAACTNRVQYVGLHKEVTEAEAAPSICKEAVQLSGAKLFHKSPKTGTENAYQETK